MRAPRSCVWVMLIVGGLLLCCPPLRAQSGIVGTYRCTSIRAGKRSLPCKSPPLTLYADGSYQLWAERGTYEVVGQYVVLSESKKHRMGRLQRKREIVFQYFDRGKTYTVTFRRRDNDSPGTAVI